MKIRSFLVIAVAFSGLLVACAGQEPASTPTATEIEDATAVPTAPPPGSEEPEPISITSTPAQADTRATAPTPDYVRPVDRGSGAQAPEFELSTLDGESILLSDLRGKIVVLNFWASWCPPCRWEMPSFERIWREYRDMGVVFIGVAVSDEEEDARESVDKAGVTYPIGLDITGKITTDYRVTGLPTTYVIDRKGREARRFGTANEAVLRIILKGQLDGS